MIDREPTAEQIVGALALPSPGAVRQLEPLPLATIRSAPDTSMTYVLGHIDRSGRISARGLLSDLGWSVGDHLNMTAFSDTLALTRTPTGTHPVCSTRFVLLPHTARQTIGIQPGDPVLLAAAPAYDLLLAHSRTALDAMVSAHLHAHSDPSPR